MRLTKSPGGLSLPQSSKAAATRRRLLNAAIHCQTIPWLTWGIGSQPEYYPAATKHGKRAVSP